MFTLEEVCTIIGIVVAGAIGGLISFVLLDFETSEARLQDVNCLLYTSPSPRD